MKVLLVGAVLAYAVIVIEGIAIIRATQGGVGQ